MNSNDLFDIIGETPEKYVRDAEKGTTVYKRSPRKFYLIAANSHILFGELFRIGVTFALVFAASSTYASGVSPMISNKSLEFINSPPLQASSEALLWFDAA